MKINGTKYCIKGCIGTIAIGNGGHLEVVESPEDGFPGIDVEFIPKDGSTGLSNPRIVFECHEDNNPDLNGRLHVHIWANPDMEDPSQTIYFDTPKIEQLNLQ